MPFLTTTDSCLRSVGHSIETKGDDMLTWALTFFILAVVAGVFGFSGIAGAAAGIAQVLFFLFLILLVVSAIAGALRGRPPV